MTLSKLINKAVEYMGKDWRGGSNNQYPQHEPRGSIVRSLPNQAHLIKPTVYKIWETLENKTICTTKVTPTNKSDNKKAKLCEEYLNQSSTDNGGVATKFSREGANSKHTTKVRPLLDKLISRKIGQYKKKFPNTTMIVIRKGLKHHMDVEIEKEVLSFLTQSLKEAYKLGKKQPHNTVEGYCCACPYDIVCMEEEIEQRVKKKLIALTQEVINLVKK